MVYLFIYPKYSVTSSHEKIYKNSHKGISFTVIPNKYVAFAYFLQTTLYNSSLWRLSGILLSMNHAHSSRNLVGSSCVFFVFRFVDTFMGYYVVCIFWKAIVKKRLRVEVVEQNKTKWCKIHKINSFKMSWAFPSDHKRLWLSTASFLILSVNCHYCLKNLLKWFSIIFSMVLDSELSFS